MESEENRPQILSVILANGASTRLVNAITRAYVEDDFPIKTIDDYLALSIDGPPQEFHRLPNIGKKTLLELDELVRKNFPKKSERKIGSETLEGKCAQEKLGHVDSFEAIEEKMRQVLNKREADVLRLRFALAGGRSHTLNELGKSFGVTRERVRQLEASSLRKLNNRFESDFSNFVENSKLQIVEKIWGDEVWVSVAIVQERIAKLDGRILLALEVGKRGVKSWLRNACKISEGGYLSPKADEKEFCRAVDMLRRKKKQISLPAPLAKIKELLGTNLENASAACRANKETIEYLGWICERPVGARTRRTINLVHYLREFGRCVPVNRETLLANLYLFGEAGASYRDLEIVLRNNKSLFINMYEEGWASLVPVEHVMRYEFLPEEAVQREASSDDYLRESESETVSAQIAKLLKKHGALSLAKIRDYLTEDRNFKYARSSIGPILILSEKFIRLAPGVYDLRASWEGERGLNSARTREIVNEQQIKYFCQALWSGESSSLYPAWRPDLFAAWANYAYEQGSTDILASMLSVCDENLLPKLTVEARAWRTRVRGVPVYRLMDELSVNITETIPMPMQVFSAAIYSSNNGRIGWMSVNRVNGNRLEDRHSASILVVLVYLGFIFPAKHWQAKHEFNKNSLGLLSDWVEWVYAGYSGWSPEIIKAIKRCQQNCQPDGWLSEQAVACAELMDVIAVSSSSSSKINKVDKTSFVRILDDIDREIADRELRKLIEEGASE